LEVIVEPDYIGRLHLGRLENAAESVGLVAQAVSANAGTSSDGSVHPQFGERSATISRATSRVLAVKLSPELASCVTSRSKNATGEAPWRTKGNSDRQGPV
jgi:hypothetical protein